MHNSFSGNNEGHYYNDSPDRFPPEDHHNLEPRFDERTNELDGVANSNVDTVADLAPTAYTLTSLEGASPIES